MFVRGGSVDSYYYLLSVAGNEGAYWSSVGGISNFAYSLYFGSGYAGSSGGSGRYIGFSVRYVALGG